MLYIYNWPTMVANMTQVRRKIKIYWTIFPVHLLQHNATLNASPSKELISNNYLSTNYK